MIAVSDAWKAAQLEALVPLSDIRIEYNVTDPGVQEEAVSTAETEEIYSAVARVVREEAVNEPLYATLEHNLWLLDTSRTMMPEPPSLTDGLDRKSVV